MLYINNITKYYDGKAALKYISLKIEYATNTVLIGPSGCGKSTLLRILSGLIKADSGQILLYEVEDSDTAEKIRLMALLFQSGFDLLEKLIVPKGLQLSSETVM